MAERRYGVADSNFCEYLIERIELSIQSSILEDPSVPLEEDEHAVVDDYKQCVQELLSLLRLVLDESSGRSTEN